LQTLSQTPTSGDMKLIVRTAAQKVTQIMNVYSKQVDEVRNQQTYDLKNVVVNNDFNTKVQNIASLNQQIREELTHGHTPNELYDKRNTLIDQLSNLASIKVTSSPERISSDLVIENLNISLYNADTGRSISIVQNGLYNTMSVIENPNTEKLTIEINSSFDAPDNSDITDQFSGGSIKGYLDIINGNGTYATSGENEFRGTLYYSNVMDTFAKNFAHELNSINGNNDPDARLLFTNATGGTDITAGNIRISQAWLNDPSQLRTTTATGSTGAPDNVLRMIAAMSEKKDFEKSPYDTGGAAQEIMFKGSFSEYMSATIGELALDIDLNNNFADTSLNVLSNLYNTRESISGVSLDEEGINLMAYQKSYNAAARYFTALDEAVDTIINRMGLVGR
jgi:flagellar hook-associated protein 1 FlgK